MANDWAENLSKLKAFESYENASDWLPFGINKTTWPKHSCALFSSTPWFASFRPALRHDVAGSDFIKYSKPESGFNHFQSEYFWTGAEFVYPWKLQVENYLAAYNCIGYCSAPRQALLTTSNSDLKTFWLMSLKDSLKRSINSYSSIDFQKLFKREWKITFTEALSYQSAADYSAMTLLDVPLDENLALGQTAPCIKLELDNYSLTIPIPKPVVQLAEECVVKFRGKVSNLAGEVCRLLTKLVAKIVRVILLIVVQLKIAVRSLEEKRREELWPLLMGFGNN